MIAGAAGSGEKINTGTHSRSPHTPPAGGVFRLNVTVVEAGTCDCHIIYCIAVTFLVRQKRKEKNNSKKNSINLFY